MKPTRKTTEIDSYEESLEKNQKSWQNEIDEIIAKIKGSSFRSADKENVIKKITMNIIRQTL